MSRAAKRHVGHQREALEPRRERLRADLEARLRLEDLDFSLGRLWAFSFDLPLLLRPL